MKEVVPYLIQEGMSQSGSYILMVLEPESGIQVPIIIGQQEAQSIVLAKERVDISVMVADIVQESEQALTARQMTFQIGRASCRERV